MRRLLLAFALLPLFSGSASAAPRWLDPELPFGNASAAPGRASAAMAPDGTIVAANLTPEGGIEVRERPPGGPFGETISIPRTAEAGREPERLRVLTGADGSAALVFDGGDLRFASLRRPGGRWTRPDQAFPVGGAVTLAPDGALWSVARPPAGSGRLAAWRLAGDGPASFTVLPRTTGLTQSQSALAVSPDGSAHVAFAEGVNNQAECRFQTKLRMVDISADGDAGPVETLDELEGQGPPPFCFPLSGLFLGNPFAISSDADGAITVVWNRNVPPILANTVARHRKPGAAFGPLEEVGDGTNVQRMLEGTGAPLPTLGYEFGTLLETRRPDGRWTQRPLARTQTFEAARTGVDGAVFAFIQNGNVIGRVFEPKTGVGELTTIAPAGATDAVLTVGGDAQGDAVMLARQTKGDVDELRLYGYDGAGPRVTKLTVPERPVAGTAALFSAEGVDVWSGPAREATWDFGDGTTEVGLSPSHTYRTSGRRTVTVRLRDDVGNETTATAAVDVAAPRDVRAPRVSDVFVTPERLESARAGELHLTVDEAGRARVVLTKDSRDGERLTVTKDLVAGEQRITLPRLSAGRWDLRLVVTDAAGNASRPDELSLRVVR